MGQITRYLVDFNRLPFYALSINTKRKGETVDDLLNTKFYISTGHRITYECLLDTGTVVHLRKPTNQVWMLKQWVKASQSKICCNALNNPTRLSTTLTSNAKENNGHSEDD